MWETQRSHTPRGRPQTASPQYERLHSLDFHINHCPILVTTSFGTSLGGQMASAWHTETVQKPVLLMAVRTWDGTSDNLRMVGGDMQDG